MREKKEVKYYSFRASVIWLLVLLVFAVFTLMTVLLFLKVERPEPEKTYVKYGTITSKLDNLDECYLCGTSSINIMSYYRQFDTIGIVELNQWEVIDLRLKVYDEEGNQIEKEGSSDVTGNAQGMEYKISSIPSRGMASATLESTDRIFDETVVASHLCQECLDKVTDTLARDLEKGKKEYFPFCIVDFETLELYPIQKEGESYFVRDYWVQIEAIEEKIKLEIFYLPK